MKLSMVSLGCDKNTVDAEMMVGLMQSHGFEYTLEETEADIMIVNTCGFIQEAKEESIQAILEAARLKEEARLKVLIVTGCLAQRYKEEILREIPEVDALLGTSSFDKIVETARGALEGRESNAFLDLNRLPVISAARVNSTGGYSAYLKIAEGCNKGCTYCAIPGMRGPYRSYPKENLLEQAKQLAAQGVKELILVAQETTLYGVDLYQKKSLPALLKALCKIPGIAWIRILYCYPEEITEELLDVMAQEEKICHYLDIPIQHASDAVLQRMARRTSRAQLEEMIRKIRKKIPDIALRTTLIAGFPGEREEDVNILADFIRSMKLERLGVFAYSEEEGTPAAGFADQVPEEEKEARRERLMGIQQEISREHLKRQVGREMQVLIEGWLPEEEVYAARSYMDLPGVDGYVFVKSHKKFISGDFCRVRIVDSSEYDLVGELL